MLEQEATGGNDENNRSSDRDVEQWLNLCLFACKLIESMLALPTDYLSQFQVVNTVEYGAQKMCIFLQLYEWSFSRVPPTSDGSARTVRSATPQRALDNAAVFEPIACRVSNALNKRVR